MTAEERAEAALKPWPSATFAMHVAVADAIRAAERAILKKAADTARVYYDEIASEISDLMPD